MSNSSLDLSENTDVRWISELVRPVQAAADGARLLIVGAMARELVLVHGFGVHSGRATRDLDFAIRVTGWDEFHRIRDSLIENAGFQPVPDRPHRLISEDDFLIDLLPFGAVETQERTIAWPPDESEIMTMRGFSEAAESGISVTLPGLLQVEVASPVGQALLKIVAWSDRSTEFPGKDAYDLTILLRKYLEAGNQDRLYEEASDLLEENDFDLEVAGAILLGRDIRYMLDEPGAKVLQELLEPELDPDGALRLAGELDCDIERALRLLRGLARGLSNEGI